MAKQDETVERVTLSNLAPAPGSRQSRKRLGRGPGSGLGKTSGKGHKGHKARTGGSTNPGFEGGQMPLYRRLPKRGFTNPFKVTYLAVNLRDLERVSGDEVTPETLVAAGKLKKASDPVKLLGHGDVTRALVVRGLPVSAQARAKIEAAGGRVEG
ncbi:MAG TPA: 50S ribosomal protein L15 [Gemmatimonadales bacterium]|nr:50S ribosomal protein L15 [Gemmatimonadales bacterium]